MSTLVIKKKVDTLFGETTCVGVIGVNAVFIYNTCRVKNDRYVSRKTGIPL